MILKKTRAMVSFWKSFLLMNDKPKIMVIDFEKEPKLCHNLILVRNILAVQISGI